MASVSTETNKNFRLVQRDCCEDEKSRIEPNPSTALESKNLKIHTECGKTDSTFVYGPGTTNLANKNHKMEVERCHVAPLI